MQCWFATKRKYVTLFPCFRCLKWFTVNMKGMLCFVSFHVSEHFSVNRKNCDRNTEGTTERFLPQYLPHWRFYFWPENWTKVYMADISMSNVYSLYWLKMSHTLFAFLSFFQHVAVDKMWELSLEIISELKHWVLWKHTWQCWEACVMRECRLSHASSSVPEKYILTFELSLHEQTLSNCKRG